MDNAMKAAVIQAGAAAALIELASMQAANRERERHGHSDAYGEADFYALIDKHGIGQNAVALYLRT